jgi:hypothetical protein
MNRILETTMTKLYSVLAATVVVVAGAATAQAGFAVRLSAPAHFSQIEKAGCGGGYAYMARRRVAQSMRRPKRHVEVARRQISKPVTVAKVEPKPVAEETLASAAVIENSTIASVAEQVAAPKVIAPVKKPLQAAAVTTDDNAAKKVATAVNDVGCKSFFASVGMTLSVPCAK